MATGENRSAVGLGKEKAMHETNGVEFATARLAIGRYSPLARLPNMPDVSYRTREREQQYDRTGATFYRG
jgi:hypothetical protein